MKARLFTLLFAGALSCAPGRLGEPSYPSGEGWFCVQARPPERLPPHQEFRGYEDGSRCARSLSECERLRDEVIADEHLTLRARVRPVEPKRAGEATHGDICSIDPGACPSRDGLLEVRPAGFSGCEPRAEAACAAWHREGAGSWRYTCLASARECEAHLDGWALHTVSRPCVVLR